MSSRRPVWIDDYDDTPLLQTWIKEAYRSFSAKALEFNRLVQLYSRALSQNPRVVFKQTVQWIWAQIFSITGLLVVLWMLVLYKGEYSLFEKSVAGCDWAGWEHWPANAYPHRLAFVTDPQLVDPHTYPGRPWPLSTLTVKHSDLYMRRAYSRIHTQLTPDTIIFLGDLFDGGREWSTATSESPEERYHRYGDGFWQKEYGRFANIFLRDWSPPSRSVGVPGEEQQGTRVLASLPGNHDLGFGQNIQLPVRDRFNAFFGESNRIDLIGNHSFVSLDTVSLSAMDSDTADPRIWRPARDFLESAKSTMHQMVEKHLQHITADLPEATKLRHKAVDIEKSTREGDIAISEGYNAAEIPTVLLTHVPLDRPLGKPCGPLRERWPPTSSQSGQTGVADFDERNSIPAQGYGWQYQNVLSTRISHLIVDSLGASISRAFSGDDHDYCDVVHKTYSNPGGGIREITVKSISWTMGVRKPGFLLASLWNEIGDDGKRTYQTHAQPETIQTHLCLLPDQISILIGYGILLGLSVLLLALRAIYAMYDTQNATPGMRDEAVKPILPSVIAKGERENTNGQHYRPQRYESHSQASSSSSDDVPLANLMARNSSATRPRSVSPLPLYGYNAKPVQARPLVSHATNNRGWQEADTSEDTKWGAMRSRNRRERRRLVDRPLLAQFGILLGEGIWKVARIVLLWYGLLLYR